MRSKILAGTIIIGLLAVIALGIVAASPNSQTSTDTRTDAEKAYDLFIAAMKDFIPGGNANTALSNITDRIIEVYTEDDPSKTAAQVKNEIVASIGGDPTVSDILKATFARFDPTGELATALANVIIDIRSGQTGETPDQIRARLSTPPTPTPTPSPTGSPTATPSPTPTPTGSPTATPTATATPVPPKAYLDIWDWDHEIDGTENMIITWDKATLVRRAPKKRGDSGNSTVLDPPGYETALNPPPTTHTTYGPAIDDSTKRIADFVANGATTTDKLNEYVFRARLYFEIGEYAKAVADFGDAIALTPTNPNPDDNDLRNLRGIARAFNKDYANAIADFTSVVESEALGDVRGAAANNRAVVKTLQANYASSLSGYDLADYDLAITHSGDSTDKFAYNNKGNTYLARGNEGNTNATPPVESDINLAIEAYASAIPSAPADVYGARFANNKGLAHVERGTAVSVYDCDDNATTDQSDLDCAIADFGSAIADTITDLPDSEEARFQNNRGLAYMDRKDTDSGRNDCDDDTNTDDSDLDCAIDDFGDAYTKAGDNPDHATFLNNRGIAYMARNTPDDTTTNDIDESDLTKAITDFTTAIDDYGGNTADIYNNRGLAYKARSRDADCNATRTGVQKDIDCAIADFTSAIRLRKDSDFYDNRGQAYVAKNDQSQAIADFTSAIKLNPADSELYTQRGNAYIASNDTTGKGGRDLAFAQKIKSKNVGCSDFTDFDANYGTSFGSDRAAANAFYAAAKEAGNADDFSALLTGSAVCPSLSSS